MASRSILDLDPRVQYRAQKILDAWMIEGKTVLVTATLRTNEEQEATYAQGRTAPGKIVTWARAGESRHNPIDGWGARAMDVVPLVGGKAVWDKDLLAELAVIAKVADPTVEWGGDWTPKKRDYPHFQWSLT